MSDLRLMPCQRSAYDHRLRELVCRTRDLGLAARLGVPRSTAKSWLRRGPREVVTAETLDLPAHELRARVLRLEHRNEVLLAILRLLLVIVRMSGARLDGERVPDLERLLFVAEGFADGGG